MKFKQIIEENESRHGRNFDLFIQFTIVLSLVSFAVATLPNITPETRELLKIIELFTIFIFTAEYVARIYVADKKLRFIFSFYGLIDLFAILPFYFATTVDLRAIRILRLMRLFRAFKLLRYSRAIQRLHSALKIAREELLLFSVVAGMAIFFAAVGIYYFENEAQPEEFASVFHSLWWAVATLTTVGYGDVYPITAGGKVFTFFVLMVGLGIVSVPTGLIASALSSARELERRQPGSQNEQNAACQLNETPDLPDERTQPHFFYFLSIGLITPKDVIQGNPLLLPLNERFTGLLTL